MDNEDVKCALVSLDDQTIGCSGLLLSDSWVLTHGSLLSSVNSFENTLDDVRLEKDLVELHLQFRVQYQNANKWEFINYFCLLCYITWMLFHFQIRYLCNPVSYPPSKKKNPRFWNSKLYLSCNIPFFSIEISEIPRLSRQKAHKALHGVVHVYVKHLTSNYSRGVSAKLAIITNLYCQFLCLSSSMMDSIDDTVSIMLNLYWGKKKKRIFKVEDE